MVQALVMVSAGDPVTVPYTMRLFQRVCVMSHFSDLLLGGTTVRGQISRLNFVTSR